MEKRLSLLLAMVQRWHLAAQPRYAASRSAPSSRTAQASEAGSLDSQSVKSSAVPGIRGYDNGKQVKGRKRHIPVDTLGLLLAVVVTAASVQDRHGARLLLTHLGGFCKKLRLIWVDGAYRGQWLDWVAHHGRFQLSLVLRSDDQKGFVVLPRRGVVERTFSWLNHHRRLSKDYEVQTPSSEAMIYIAMIRLMLRRLARTSLFRQFLRHTPERSC